MGSPERALSASARPGRTDRPAHILDAASIGPTGAIPAAVTVLNDMAELEEQERRRSESRAAIEAIVPSGTMATRCLRVHSAIGSDARHVASSIDVVARLSPADRTAVMHAAFETAARITSPTDYPGDEAAGELQARYRR